jgi:hypothetical protein
LRVYMKFSEHFGMPLREGSDHSGMLRETRKWTPRGVLFLNSQE